MFSKIFIINCDILNTKRLNRRVKEGNEIKYVPTSGVYFTISGKMFPKQIEINDSPMKVIPKDISPVLQCDGCLLYGHRVNRVKKNLNVKYVANITCPTKGHISKNRKCNEFLRQKDIKQLMAF